MKIRRSKPLALTGLAEVEPLPDSAVDAILSSQTQTEASPRPAAPRASRDTGLAPPVIMPQMDAGPRRVPAAGLGRWLYVVAVAAAVVWAGGLAAFVAGFQTRYGAFDYSPLQWLLLGLMAVLPASFILLAAFALRQGARMAADARQMRALAEDLAVPTALAVDQTGGALQAMRREIEKASEAAVAAREPIIALREALAVESQRLSDAAAKAQATGRLLTEALAQERSALGEIAGGLQLQAADAAEALARQAKVVADASDLAQAQLGEAQAALAARAADLVVAAGDARHAADLAGDTLSSQIGRLESTGQAVAERVQGVSEAVGEESQHLAALADSLRNDQEDISARFETRRAQLAEAAADSRAGAIALGEASATGAEALRQMIATAADEVRRLAETAQREQQELEAQARAAVSLFSGAVAEERAAIADQTREAIGQLAAAAEEARQAASSQAAVAGEAARAHTAAALEGLERLADALSERIESLSEAAFATGQRADQAFDGRITAARQGLEQLGADLTARLEQLGEVAAAAGQRADQALDSRIVAAREGLERLADDVAARIDNLGEAAFAAGQKADQVFDDRVAAARRMIDQSLSLAEETGERSAQRIEHTLTATRTALSEMQRLLADIDAQITRLPQEAQAQAQSVRTSLEQGIGDLTAAARRAAQETQAIDAAFQERVRRNYDVLSDAMRLMGQVAGPADNARPVAGLVPAAPVLKAPTPWPAPEAAPAAAPEPVVMPELRAAAGDRSIRLNLGPEGATARLGGEAGSGLRPAALSSSEPAARHTEAPSPAAAGLRPRLKLTPTSPPADEAQPAAPAGQAGRKPEPGGDEWTWKDLLSSMEEPASLDDDSTTARLIGEIEGLGIDPAALLPRPRIDEIAAALQTGDASGAREVVRRLAPAAIRRLSRRVLTDKVLRAEADRYVRRYEALLSDSAERDRAGYMIATLLASEAGRAFLLLDAAVGDLH